MSFFKEISSNHIFWTSVFACFLAQVLKIFTGEKNVDIARIFTSGGMPSSHSSFVTCMATMIGIKHGFNSTYFAMAAVLSAIVMYDASGVRQAVGKQATMLNQIIEDLQKGLPIKHEKLKELIGHTPKQVFFGAILGIIVGVVM